MAEYFAGGNLRFIDGEWRDNDGNIVEISLVRHGRWIMNSNRPDMIICSYCDAGFDVWKHEENDFYYCPHCNTKMDFEG